jgi:hypothetical protein
VRLRPREKKGEVFTLGLPLPLAAAARDERADLGSAESPPKKSGFIGALERCKEGVPHADKEVSGNGGRKGPKTVYN